MRKTIVTAAIALLAAFPARAEELQKTTAIRAGRNLATTVCFTCHAIPNAGVPAPIMGPGIPAFAEIANRPDVSADWLVQQMKNATWHDDALPPTRLPMSHLSDRERTEVASYIMSLRK